MSKLVSVRINDNNMAMIDYISNHYKEKYGFDARTSDFINTALEEYLLKLTTNIAKERAGH